MNCLWNGHDSGLLMGAYVFWVAFETCKCRITPHLIFQSQQLFSPLQPSAIHLSGLVFQCSSDADNTSHTHTHTPLTPSLSDLACRYVMTLDHMCALNTQLCTDLKPWTGLFPVFQSTRLMGLRSQHAGILVSDFKIPRSCLIAPSQKKAFGSWFLISKLPY